MIVERQRSDAVEDLVEEILGMDLLHDLPIDAVAHAQQPIAVDAVHRLGQDRGDARDQPPIVTIEFAPRRDQRERAPGAAPAPDRANQHVALQRRVGVPDVARQHVPVPVGVLGQREQQIGRRPAGPQRRDAAVRGLEEVARVAERVAQRLVRLAHVFQVRGQAVDELERGQLPLYGQHGASGWFPACGAVKYGPRTRSRRRVGAVRP
jgi:hypothetical protein